MKSLRGPRNLFAALAVGALLCSTAARAQNQVAAPALQKKTIALVAAIGDQFQHVRQKPSVGTNLDPYTRTNLRIPDQSLNLAVLKGLDRAIASEQPDAVRVLLALNVGADMAIAPKEREAKVMERLLSALQDMPGRKDWDEIIAITPKWLFSGRQGMGSKLTGIGLYVQPLSSGNLAAFGDAVQSISPSTNVETVEREDTKSDVYVAPFFYVQVTTFDAKTLRILKQDAKYDFRKTVNKNSAALDVEKGFTPDEMAGVLLDFVEAASVAAVSQRNAQGTVEVGPARVAPKQ